MWVTPLDIESRWLHERQMPKLDVVGVWIGDAEALVLSEFPDIQQRIDDGDLSLADVKRIVSQMVLRVLANPDNVRSRQQGIGGYSDGTTFAGEMPGGLNLTDEDRATLSGLSSKRGKAFTVDGTPAVGAARELQNAWVNGPPGTEPGADTW